MGEHIKKGDTIIKIGVMDEMFFTRKQLLQFKEEGFRGFHEGNYNDGLDKILNDSSTLYGYDNLIETGGLKGLEDTIFTIPNCTTKHKDVFLFHNGYQYKVKCQEKENNLVKAELVGEGYINERYVSIFRCHCCGALLNIDHVVAMYLRNAYPEFPFYSYDDPDFEEDLCFLDSVILIADKYDFSQFYSFLGEKRDEIESLVKEYGYPTLYNFHLQASA